MSLVPELPPGDSKTRTTAEGQNIVGPMPANVNGRSSSNGEDLNHVENTKKNSRGPGDSTRKTKV